METRGKRNVIGIGGVILETKGGMPKIRKSVNVNGKAGGHDSLNFGNIEDIG